MNSYSATETREDSINSIVSKIGFDLTSEEVNNITKRLYEIDIEVLYYIVASRDEKINFFLKAILLDELFKKFDSVCNLKVLFADFYHNVLCHKNS